MVEEALQVIRAVWTGDDIGFEGRHFTAAGITAHPRPTSPPPIWIGGNTAAARRRVTEHGDGWCPFPAAGVLARTARTDPMDSLETLRAGIDDLRRRLDEAGRDPATVDVTFSNAVGGVPGAAGFDAAAYLGGVQQLAELGVTWIQVQVPGDSLAHATDVIAQFGEQVIAKL